MADYHLLFDRTQRQIRINVSELSEADQISFFRALSSWAQSEAEFIEFYNHSFADGIVNE